MSTSKKHTKRVVVDDVIKSGKSLTNAMQNIERILLMFDPEKIPPFKLKSLVLLSQGDSSRRFYKPDYVIENVSSETSIILPYGRG